MSVLNARGKGQIAYKERSEDGDPTEEGRGLRMPAVLSGGSNPSKAMRDPADHERKGKAE